MVSAARHYKSNVLMFVLTLFSCVPIFQKKIYISVTAEDYGLNKGIFCNRVGFHVWKPIRHRVTRLLATNLYQNFTKVMHMENDFFSMCI